jgi:hypothetical protein
MPRTVAVAEAVARAVVWAELAEAHPRRKTAPTTGATVRTRTPHAKVIETPFNSWAGRETLSSVETTRRPSHDAVVPASAHLRAPAPRITHPARRGNGAGRLDQDTKRKRWDFKYTVRLFDPLTNGRVDQRAVAFRVGCS